MNSLELLTTYSARQTVSKIKFKRKLFAINSLVNGHYLLGFIVLLLLTLTSLLETFSFAMLLPILENTLGERSDSNLSSIFKNILSVFPKGDHLGISLLFFVLAIFAKCLTSLISSSISTHFSYKIFNEWREQILSNYLGASTTWIRSQKLGYLIENLHHQPAKASKFFRYLIDLCSHLSLNLFLLFALFFIYPKVTLLFMLGSLIFFIISSTVALPFLKKLTLQSNSLSQESLQVASETLRAHRISWLYSLKIPLVKKYDVLNDDFRKNNIRLVVCQAIPANLIEPIIAVVIAFFIYNYLGNSEDSKNILPVLATFVIIGQKFLTSLVTTIQSWLRMNEAYPSLEIVSGLISEHHDFKKNESEAGMIQFKNLTREIRFQNVRFGYDSDKEILTGLNLSIPAHRTIGIVGPSGIGKSTLTDLLTRLISPSSGEILLDGININEINAESIRRKISYVEQFPFFFHDTIRFNLTFNDPTLTDQDIREALTLTGAEFVYGFKHGLEEVVGDTGSQLSGGQRQRLAFARALLKKPDILILDEATSSLDPESERLINSTLKTLKKSGLTIIIIAHRDTALAEADLVYDLALQSFRGEKN